MGNLLSLATPRGLFLPVFVARGDEFPMIFTLPPFFLPVFTEVRGRVILGSSFAGCCIEPVL
jgi:hypothetical protein